MVRSLPVFSLFSSQSPRVSSFALPVLLTRRCHLPWAKSNRASWSWTEASKTLSQNKRFLFLKVRMSGICYSDKMLLCSDLRDRNTLIFSIFIHDYIIFPLYSSSYTPSLYPPHSHWYQPPDRTILPSCSSFFKKRHFCFYKIAIQGVSLWHWKRDLKWHCDGLFCPLLFKPHLWDRVWDSISNCEDTFGHEQKQNKTKCMRHIWILSFFFFFFFTSTGVWTQGLLLPS
jgi:hypothetical protein